MTRVQIPAYSDHWMKGDRYGEIIEIVKEDVCFPGEPWPRDWVEIAHVKLDKSGKITRVYLDDCEVLS